jgi:hypothetical protein
VITLELTDKEFKVVQAGVALILSKPIDKNMLDVKDIRSLIKKFTKLKASNGE